VLSVPLNARGRTLGAMTLVATSGLRRYGEDDVEFASDLARRAGLATESGLMHEAEQRVRGAAEVLQQVTAALAPTMTASEVVDILVREAILALAAAAGWIAEVDHAAGELRLLGSRGYEPDLERAYARLSLDPTTRRWAPPSTGSRAGSSPQPRSRKRIPPWAPTITQRASRRWRSCR